MTAAPRMTRGLAVLFAVGGGLAVGNLYWSQPLLDVIARDTGTARGAAGVLVTATQLGYAAGVLLLVPLGDLVDRRRFVPGMLLLSSAALAACAAAPNLPVLAVACFAVGCTTVSGQLLTPLTGDLASDADRGRMVGIVASGLLTGIILARTVSGLVGGVLGWRAVFAGASVLAVGMAVVLSRAIPALPRKTDGSWPRLVASVPRLVRDEPVLRAAMLLGGLGFAVFTMFWTALTFLLAAPPYSLPTTAIGLFGVAGLLGAVGAQGAGRLYDRGLAVPVIGIAWVAAAAAWVLALVGQHVLPLVVAAIVVLDLAVQAQSILVQNRVFGLGAEARSRRNTAFVTGNFLFGAAGSLLASLLWGATGWSGVAVAGLVLSLVALGVWAVHRRGALAPARARIGG